MTIIMNRGGLQVRFSDGTIIQEPVSAETFVFAIDNAVKQKGIDAVLRTGIVWCNFPLISKTADIYTIEKYRKTIKQCKCGLFVNTCSSNKQKKELLQKISDILHLGWNVSVIF